MLSARLPFRIAALVGSALLCACDTRDEANDVAPAPPADLVEMSPTR